MKIDLKEIITYGSILVSLTVAYYTHEVRLVKLETQYESDRKVIVEIKAELKEIKDDVKQLLKVAK